MCRELNDAIYGEAEIQKFREVMKGDCPFRCRLELLATGDP